jgi:hypothetical protein
MARSRETLGLALDAASGTRGRTRWRPSRHRPTAAGDAFPSSDRNA